MIKTHCYKKEMSVRMHKKAREENHRARASFNEILLPKSRQSKTYRNCGIKTQKTNTDSCLHHTKHTSGN